MLLVKQCKHITTAHMGSLSLHMEDSWDMKDMEDTLETSVLFLSFLIPNSTFPFTFTFFSSSTPAVLSSAFPPQATPCRPSRPPAARIELVPAWFPIHNQPLGNCPNILAMDQNTNHDFMAQIKSLKLSLRHTSGGTWYLLNLDLFTKAGRLSWVGSTDPVLLGILSQDKIYGHIFVETLLEKMLREQLVPLEMVRQCWEGRCVGRVPSPFHRVLVHLQI